MTLVSFLALSLALHAAVLSFPVSFSRQSQIEVMRVTILPMGQESIGASQTGKNGSPAPTRIPKSAMRAPASVGSSAVVSSTLHPAQWETIPASTTPLTSGKESAAGRKVEPQPSREAELQIVAAEAAPNVSDSSVALISAITNAAETHGVKRAASASADSDASGARTNRAEMSGNDIYGSGGIGGGISAGRSGLGVASAGTGSGAEKGQGAAENNVALTRARYRDTPRPDYPDSARREGREGRVLLRVLVDDQGRTRTVEINSSSGSDALDRAAAEAIRRWRFYPARNGDQSVESWLRIPVEFRLADVKPR